MSIIGSLPVEHFVDPNGSLVLKIPITVPPAKLAPTISLSYHSAVHTMSVLGHGWALDTFGVIQRVAATVAQDKFAGSINYDSNDRFSLNGQRIIKLSPSGNEYRYEVEQWSKIIAVGLDSSNPDYWVEYLPNGTVHMYGSTTDSNVKALGQTVTRVWARSETHDPFSNYTSFQYSNNSDGSFYISKITYGGNRNLNLRPQREIVFSYEDRPDNLTEYIGGYAFTLKKRLAVISAYFNNELLTKHSLVYDKAPVTGWSRLQTIFLSDSQGNSVTPLSFNWIDAIPTIFNKLKTLSSIKPDCEPSRIMPISVTGNGRTDLVLVSSQYNEDMEDNILYLDVHLADGAGGFNTTAEPGSGSTGLSYPNHLLGIDANGNGCTDLLHIVVSTDENGTATHTLTVLLSTDKGYKAQSSTTFMPDVASGRYISGDFEGNGNVGLAYLYTESKDDDSIILRLVQLTCNGTTFSVKSRIDGAANVNVETSQIIAADFNGNGLQDIFVISSQTIGSDVVCEISFFESQKGTLSFRSDNPFSNVDKKISRTSTTSFLTLPEPDGKTGLLCLSRSSDGYLRYQTLRSSGKTLVLGTETTTKVSYRGNITLGRYTSINSLDLVNTFQTSTGTEISVLHYYNGSFITLSGVQQVTDTTLSGCDVEFADDRGIARADCIFHVYDEDDEKLHLYNLACAGDVSFPADFITSYISGLGAKVSAVYAPLTDNTVYTTTVSRSDSALSCVNESYRISTFGAVLNASGAVSLPVSGRTRSRLVHFPKYVVKEVSAWADPTINPDIYAQDHYSYKNARVAFDGRGWLGFESVTQASMPLGSSTTSNYYQTFPFLGQIYEVQTHDTATGTPLRLYATTWNATSEDKQPNRVTTISHVKQVSYEGSVQSVMVDVYHTYDAYANLTNTTITTSGKQPLMIENTYYNDSSTWIIGSKLSEKITSNKITLRHTCRTYLEGTQHTQSIRRWVAGTVWLLQEFAFDRVGNVVKNSGPGSACQTFKYDATFHFPTVVTNTANKTTNLTQTLRYDLATGKLASIIGYSGYIKEYSYDVLGRVTKISEGDDASKLTLLKTWQYVVSEGYATRIRKTLCDDDSSSWAVHTSYLDGLGRVWKTVQPCPSNPSETIYTELLHDGAGRIVKQYRNYTSTTQTPRYATFTYDGLSRQVKVVNPAATSNCGDITTTSSYTYTNNQLRITEVTSGGSQPTVTKTKLVEYFANPDYHSNDFSIPLTVSTIDELGSAMIMSFDALRRVCTVTDPGGVQLSQSYDGLSREIARKISNPSGITPRLINDLTIEHDDTSNNVKILNALLNSTVMIENDYLNRPIKRSTSEETFTFVYDVATANAQGRLASVSSTNGVMETFAFDRRGCLVESCLIIDGRTFETHHEYTASRQLRHTVNPDGSHLFMTFFVNSDALQSIVLRDGCTGMQLFTSFDNLDNPSLYPLKWSSGNGLTCTYTLADNGLPINAAFTQNGSAYHTQSWSLNGYGQVTGYSDDFAENNGRTYQYDESGRVVQSQFAGSAQANSFSYDKSANILSKDGLSFKNNGWQLTSIVNSNNDIHRAFEYSEDGCLTQEKDGSGTVLRTMKYNTQGQLVNFNGSTFLYNFRGRMVKSSLQDGSITYYPSETYELSTKSDDPVETHTSYMFHRHRLGSISTLYLDTPVVGNPMPVAPPLAFYYYYDQLGSVVAVSDTNGRIATSYRYDTYGEVDIRGPDISRYKYSGKEDFDGLYYFGARFYDPTTGRFTVLDGITVPLKDIKPSTFNHYAFSRDDPVNFVDINGNMSFWWHLAWHLGIDTVLIAAGAAATFAGMPMLADPLFGAGLGGFAYDAGALYDAVRHGHKELNDAIWGTSIVTGVVFAGTGAGLKALASKTGYAALEATDLLGARAGGKFVKEEVIALSKRGGVQLVSSAVNSSASSVSNRILINNIQHNEHDLWDDIPMAFVKGIETGIISGTGKGLWQFQKVIRKGDKFFYNTMRNPDGPTRLLDSEVSVDRTVIGKSYRLLNHGDALQEV